MSTWCWPDCSQRRFWPAGTALRELGYGPGEIGDDVDSFLALAHPEDQIRLRSMAHSLLESGPVGEHQVELRVRRSDGGYSWMRIFASVERPSGSDRYSAFGFAWIADADEQLDRSALKLTQDALHTVLNEIGHPVVLMTTRGIVLQANQAASRVVGPRSGNASGPRFCAFLHEQDGSPIVPDFVERVVRSATRGDHEVWRFDRWWHVYLVPLRNAENEVRRLLLLAQDISSIKAEQAAQLAREKALTRTLVREVHHRIKNHLQGLVGLLRSHSLSRRPVREVFDDAIVQIQSIATVHGLLARDGATSIEFSALITQIVTALRVGTCIPVRFALDPREWQPITVPQEDSVPLAIAIGELFMNAVKHTSECASAHVEGRLAQMGADIELNIINAPAWLPEGFGLSGSAAPTAGIELVRALLPRGRAELEIFQDGDKVTTRLRLRTRQP